MLILLFGDATPSIATSLINGYDITHPVVLDDGWSVSSRYGLTSLPSYTLLAPGLKIVSTDEWWMDNSTIERVLPR